MSGSLESLYIVMMSPFMSPSYLILSNYLVIGGKNIRVPPWRIPAGIYISINVDSWRRWKSAISVLSSDESAAWADTVTLSPQASPAFSVEIRASYEGD
ncbi:hypothetical protein BDR05DRAFT_1006879 [Suillus weaverae]|nr:hypothetical protein BDR05DRAFT_1006879 [Suillus weaverae]